MRIRSELIKLTVFIAVSAVFLGLLVSTLTRAQFGPTSTFNARLVDASGLENGDLVRVAGVQVGQVEEVAVDTGNEIEVKFSLSEDQKLTDRTQVFVRYENLLGDRYLELSQEPGEGSELSPGDTIPRSRTHPALDLDVLLNGFKPLFAGLDPQQVNELATNIVSTLQGRAGTVQQLLRRTGSLTSTLADRDVVIGDLVDNLNVVLGSLNANDAQLRGTVTQLQQLVSGLAEDRKIIGDAVVGINRLTVSVSGLLAEIRPSLKTDIARTRLVAAIVERNIPELRSLLADIPDALEILSRVGSHGAFFNFYLCGVSLRITGPDGPIDVPGLKANNTDARCQPLEEQ